MKLQKYFKYFYRVPRNLRDYLLNGLIELMLKNLKVFICSNKQNELAILINF